jgi:hypothetical protein
VRKSPGSSSSSSSSSSISFFLPPMILNRLKNETPFLKCIRQPHSLYIVHKLMVKLMVRISRQTTPKSAALLGIHQRLTSSLLHDFRHCVPEQVLIACRTELFLCVRVIPHPPPSYPAVQNFAAFEVSCHRYSFFSGCAMQHVSI